MKKLNIILSIAVFVLGFSFAANSFASEGDQMKGSPMAEEKGSQMKGSAMAEKKGDVAIGGYCPVCILGGKYVKGDSKFSTEYKGKTYYFPGAEQQEKFVNDPETYVADIEAKYEALKAKSEASEKGSGMDKGSN